MTKVKNEQATSIVTKSCDYPVSRLAPKFEPVDQLAVVEEAKKMLGAVATGKLQLIVEQINFLKKQAKTIIEEAEINLMLHKASCSFEKRVGHTYHLYERQDGTVYFSMISPEEWNNNPPHVFRGSYRLESDMSWSSGDSVDEDSDPVSTGSTTNL